MKHILSCITLVAATLAAEGQTKNQLQKALFAEEVEQDATKAAAIYQSMIDESAATPRYLAMARFRLAKIHQQAGRGAEATALLKALASDPNAPADWVVQAKWIMDAGTDSASRAKESGATALYDEIKDKLWYWHSGNGKPFGTVRFLPEGRLETTVGVDWLIGWAQVDRRQVRINNVNGKYWIIGFSEDGSKTAGVAAPGVVDTFKFLGVHPTPSQSIDDAEIEYLKDLLTSRPDAIAQWRIPCKLAKRNRLKSITYLLDQGVHVDLRDKEGYHWTPLMEAVGEGHLEMVKLILARGAGVNSLDSRNASPLHISVARENMEMIRLVLESGADLEQSSGWIDSKTGGDDLGAPLHAAIQAGNLAAVRLLLERGANINAVTPAKSHSALNRALGKRDFTLVRLLLEKGADPNVPRDGPVNPLTQAAYVGDAEIVKLMIAKGAGMERQSAQLLHTFDSPRTVGAPMHAAVREGNIKVSTVLADSGSKIDQPSPRYQETPLHAAALHGNTAMCRWLLEKGANPQARLADQTDFQSGWLPLHSAAWSGSIEVARLLMEKGAAPSAPCSIGGNERSPFHIVVLKGNVPLVRLMMDHASKAGPKSLPALLAQIDTAGNTALHLAVSREAVPNPEIVRLLIGAGASQNALNRLGRTPRQLAHDLDIGTKDPAVESMIGR